MHKITKQAIRTGLKRYEVGQEVDFSKELSQEAIADLEVRGLIYPINVKIENSEPVEKETPVKKTTTRRTTRKTTPTGETE